MFRPGRITFIWSEGAASFEPYHLEGDACAQLLNLANQIHAKLAEDDGADLKALGRRLYRAIFPASVAALEAWFTGLAAGKQIDKLEIVSDAPGLIPWNIVCEDAASDFWGTRFNLGVGRRINVLRLNSAIVNPIQLAAIDLGLLEQLTPDQQALLNPLRDAAQLVHSTEALADELKKQAPDVLMLLVRFEQGQARLGGDALHFADLQTWIEEAGDGNTDPILVVMGCGASAEQAAWTAWLAGATATFAGLVANEALLPAHKAFAVGAALTQQFVKGTASVGEVLRSLRQDGGAAQAFSAFCPPQVRVVAEGAAAEADPDLSVQTMPLPDRPYRPFAAFDVGDRALFVGREADTLKGALLLDQAGTRVLLLHGGPAIGKTSYLQAGLLPALETEHLGYRALRDRMPLDEPAAESEYPILILRATDDLAGQFADALSVFCAQPYTYTTPAGTQVTVDLPGILHEAVLGKAAAGPTNTAIQPIGELAPTSDENMEELTPREVWIALRDQVDFLATLLDAITRALPFELVIAVDQVDELLTLVRTPQQRVRRQKALDSLGRLVSGSARIKLILTMRSHAVGPFVDLLPQGHLPASWQSFALRPLSETDLVDALLWPTNGESVAYANEVPAEKYGFAFDEGVAKRIVAEAIDQGPSVQQSPLALVQAAGAWLYSRAVVQRKQSVVRVADLTELGKTRDAMMKCLEMTIERLPIAKASRKAVRALIGRLCTSHADGTVSRDLLPADALKERWQGTADPVNDVINHAADAEGLFEIQQLLIGGQAKVYVSLPQDSLARLGRDIDKERERDAFAHTRVIDVLWIMVPLVFLAAAVSFWFTRNFVGGTDAGREETMATLKGAREKIEGAERERIMTILGTRNFLYQGILAQADLALRADNALRARAMLLSQPAQQAFSEERQFKVPELRGFEWKHLWHHLNSERWRLEGHRGVVKGVAVSPDGKLAASCGVAAGSVKDDSPLRLWDLKTGKLLARAPNSGGAVYAVAFAPDGKTLAAAGADKLVRLWDVSGGAAGFKAIKTLTGHQGAVHAVAFGKDPQTLASAGADQSVILWDLAARKPKHVLKEHAAPIAALAFADDGKTLVSAGAEATLIFWDAQAGKKRQAVQTPFHKVAALAASPDGKAIGAGGVEIKSDAEVGIIRVYSAAGGEETRTPIQHSVAVLSLAFAPDGAALASGGRDQVVRLFDLASGAEKRKWIGHLGAIDALAFAKDGSAIVSGGHDQMVKVWNPSRSSGPEVIRAHADWVQALALDATGTLLASGARDGTVKLWDPAATALLYELPKQSGAITALAFSQHKEKTYLAVGTRDAKSDGEIKIWQIARPAKTGVTATLKHALTGHKKGITALAFCPTPARADVLVSGSADKSVKVWDIQTGKATESYTRHADEVRCVAFAGDGLTFASGGRDRSVCLYVLGGKEPSVFSEMHLASIESLALAPLPGEEGEPRAGRYRLLTASADQSLRHWMIDAENKDATRTEMGLFRTHVQPLTGVLYSKVTSGLIVSASWDGTIKLFSLEHERLTLTGHHGAVRAIVMAPEQAFLASAGNDGTVRIWRAYRERK